MQQVTISTIRDGRSVGVGSESHTVRLVIMHQSDSDTVQKSMVAELTVAEAEAYKAALTEAIKCARA